MTRSSNIRNTGAHIGFAGAVWTDRPHLQVLSPTLPLFYHATDVNMRMRAARYFGAAKKAISGLRRYYQQELDAINALDPHNRPKPEFPHPDHYVSLSDSTIHAFNYMCPLDNDKLVFRGKADDDDICIKFVCQYSKDAHLKCSSSGFAPALRGFQLIPGGWYMVIMDYIGDTYEELYDSPIKTSFVTEVRDKVESLHQAGYVHGDLRTTNVMVKKNGGPGIMLIDFDWAGVIGDVRYPMNVNREGVTRPAGAYDGELIMADHDIEMVDIM
jgi:serine/threonine protein kinase